VPVSDTLFRLESEVDATRVFAPDDQGTLVLTGGPLYAERTSRWRVEAVRMPVLASVLVVLTPLVIAVGWLARARWSVEPGFWWLKFTLVACPVALLIPVLAIDQGPGTGLGLLSGWTATIFLGTVAFPLCAALSLGFAVDAWRRGAGRWLSGYAMLVSTAGLIVSGYLYGWGMVGFKPWAF
jgi:hypothetical protein